MTRLLAQDALEGLARWRRLEYRRFGICGQCGYDRDETGRPLVVARAAGSRRWFCASCYLRAHVRRRRRSA